MMTQIDELENDRHFKMSLVEFYDAFGRLADKLVFKERSERLDI